jgi:hypothetical protein
MDAYVEVQRPDGTQERHRIEGEQTTVGRSPAAGITVTGFEELEPEHLLVAPRPEGCWVAVAKGARVGAVVRGQPFEHGMLAWGTEIEIGSLRLRISDQLPGAKKEDKRSPVVVIGGALLVGLLAWLVFSEDDAKLPTSTATPPPLFGAAVPCPAQGPGALHVAAEAAEEAAARAERYVFAAQDGVRAVNAYARAQACFLAGGNAAEAQRMQDARDRLARRIEEDYRSHRLRLERALEKSDLPEALLQARALRRLTSHLQGDYVDYLTLLEQRLQLLVDSGGSMQ